ncbi:hypothetical protein FBQ96_11515 [Nitrospirales bacterium NOB]|nr:MAG: hypothetical protein UZ03_NOB001000173 [Nitrospira sp. OLB3]MBV6471568.1 hypothetical protein [Nitrospirota bacterium]MCE7964406.1 hypothetical protein [Nitrospira sp. NTP2]MDL1890189.1 hypothetical protein [Nitrospirales bacterium NOB]MEB2340352.1 hypothetical protein [Nitrospirales bacterium]QOJ34184.1 MAG: hypothetical protein HRU82_04090 [Nitrospira sp.]
MGTDPGTLGTAALAIGALGGASQGIVDGLFKSFTWFDSAGFERVFAVEGKEGGRRWPVMYKTTLDPLLPVLKIAYGKDVMELLRAQYRSGRVSGDLPRTLRQGVRIGFGMMEVQTIVLVATELGVSADMATLAAQAIDSARRQRSQSEQFKSEGDSVSSSQPAMTDEQRSAMARLETMIDARIDAALALADTQYVSQTKLLATFVSLVISFAVGWSLDMVPGQWGWCLLVGLAAVPLSPVAKDLSTAIHEAAKTLKAR